jgi:hypothetical protein
MPSGLRAILMRTDARMAFGLASIRVDDGVIVCTITRGEILFAWRGWLRAASENELESIAGNLFAVLPCDLIPPGSW